MGRRSLTNRGRGTLRAVPTRSGLPLATRSATVCSVALACSLAACSGEVPSDDGVPSPGDPAGGAPGEPAEPDPPPRANAECGTPIAGRATARLLTRLQYDNTIRDLLGDDTSPGGSFPEEATFLGFGNNADVHRASLLLSEQHASAARSVAAAAVAGGLSELLPCEEQSSACMQQFVSEFGYRAFRRPLLPGESEPLMDLFEAANGEWGFEKAVELVLQAILQSPQVLYRTESLASASPIGATPAAGGVAPPSDAVALDSYQIASRLSYFLWNTMPDDELFRMADAGMLVSTENIEAQARRMIQDERARSTVADFHRQWLGLSRFGGLARQEGAGQAYSTDFNAAWQQSLEQFAQHAFWEAGGTVESLLQSSEVFVPSAEMGQLYGLRPTADGSPVEDPNRIGLLSQPALMALLSHPDQSAPIQRGKFVREQLLCQTLRPPPPTVDASPPDPDPNATTRERFAQHTSQEECAGCHRMIDGIGFGLEGFDHLGRFRSEENGLPIDTSGDIQLAVDATLNGEFEGVAELSQKLAASEQVEACLATQWFRYAMGRAEQDEDACSLSTVQRVFADSGGSFTELLVALTTTGAFRFRPMGEQDLANQNAGEAL